jgi:hypothetical protein
LLGSTLTLEAHPQPFCFYFLFCFKRVLQ